MFRIKYFTLEREFKFGNKGFSNDPSSPKCLQELRFQMNKPPCLYLDLKQNLSIFEIAINDIAIK